jgi:hypothetical protein
MKTLCFHQDSAQPFRQPDLRAGRRTAPETWEAWMARSVWGSATTALLLAFSAATPALALGVFAGTRADAPDPENSGGGVFDLDVASSFSGTVHASSEAGGFGALAVAEASTEFGVNRAFARATSPDLNLRFPPVAAAFAASAWSDEITIFTAASAGFVSVEFQFAAFAIQSSYAYPSPVLNYEVQLLDLRAGNQVTYYRVIVDGNGGISTFLPNYADGFELDGDSDRGYLRIVGVRLPFVANQAFGITSRLGCEARAPYNDANLQVCNANGTSLWGGIKAVTDVSGNALTDWTVASASGTDYTKSLIPPPVDGVPEPATWAMLILGLGLTGVVMRRRIRNTVLA